MAISDKAAADARALGDAALGELVGQMADQLDSASAALLREVQRRMPGVVEGAALRVWPNADRPRHVRPNTAAGMRAMMQGLNTVAGEVESMLSEAQEVLVRVADGDHEESTVARAQAWLDSYGQFAGKGH